MKLELRRGPAASPTKVWEEPGPLGCNNLRRRIGVLSADPKSESLFRTLPVNFVYVQGLASEGAPERYPFIHVFSWFVYRRIRNVGATLFLQTTGIRQIDSGTLRETLETFGPLTDSPMTTSVSSLREASLLPMPWRSGCRADAERSRDPDPLAPRRLSRGRAWLRRRTRRAASDRDREGKRVRSPGLEALREASETVTAGGLGFGCWAAISCQEVESGIVSDAAGDKVGDHEPRNASPQGGNRRSNARQTAGALGIMQSHASELLCGQHWAMMIHPSVSPPLGSSRSPSKGQSQTKKASAHTDHTP